MLRTIMVWPLQWVCSASCKQFLWSHCKIILCFYSKAFEHQLRGFLERIPFTGVHIEDDTKDRITIFERFFIVVNTVLIHINYDDYTAIFAFSGFVSWIQKRLNSIELNWIESKSKSKSASKRHITIKNTLLNWFIHNESRKVFWTPIIEGMKYETIITIITVCYTNFPCFLHVAYHVNK